MKKLTRGCFVRNAALGFLAVSFLASGAGSRAQEKEKGREKELAPAVDQAKGGKLRTAIRAGYTRFGSPEDKLNPNGSVRPMAWDLDVKDKLIGCTIYFVVLARTGNDGDTWGTGMAGFDGKFIEGKNYQKNFSPALDTPAKYLYLYQVVNDRGLPPVSEVKLAAGQEMSNMPLPIASASLTISVDPRYITSWGHFRGTGFVATVPNRKANGDVVVPAADKAPKDIRLAVSSNASILGEIGDKRYRGTSARPAPTHSLGSLADSFGLGPSNLNLKQSEEYKELENRKVKGIALAAFEDKVLQAQGADHAREPEFVQLLYYPAKLRSGQPLTTEFRADWRGKEILDLGRHSVVFGFTSDLPPKDEPIRIEDLDKARGADAKIGGAQGK